MIAFIIAPFFIALLTFIIYRSINYLHLYCGKWTKFIVFGFSILLYGGIVDIVIAFLLPASSQLKRLLTRIGYNWLGVIIYFFVALVISIVIRNVIWLISNKDKYNKTIAKNITAVFVVLFTSIMSIYGYNNAHNLHITNYEVNIDKKSNLDELNVVLLADLHIGYNVGLVEIQDMVDKVNSCNPDVVVIAGDVFDNEYEAIEEPDKMIEILRGMNSKYGTYVTYGNHDIQEKILVGFTFNWSKEAKAKVQADERMNDFIEQCGFKFLYDDYAIIEDSIYVYGRPDKTKINFGNYERVCAKDVTKDLDKSLPIIVLDHQPAELNELASAGVDLDLCGHTHNGQIWPGTISIKWLWDNAYGLKDIDNMTSIVTSGVGLFGPNMRTGCIAEICDINISFNE